jgi:hypothetical protein
MKLTHYSLVTFHIDDDAFRAEVRELLVSSGVPSSDIVRDLGKTLLVYIEDGKAQTLMLDKMALWGLVPNEIITIDFDENGFPNVDVYKEDMVPSPW